MKVYDWDKKDNIETSFPQEHYESYLFQAYVIDKDDPTYEQIEKIFLLSRDDFKIGKLSLDEFSSICNALFGFMTKKVHAGANNALFDTLLAGGELSFYVRTEDEQGLKQLTIFLKEIHDYKSKR